MPAKAHWKGINRLSERRLPDCLRLRRACHALGPSGPGAAGEALGLSLRLLGKASMSALCILAFGSDASHIVFYGVMGCSAAPGRSAR